MSTTETEKRLTLESVDAWEEDVVFSLEDNDQLRVAVAEEKTVGSYNQTFTCSIHLSKEQTQQLQDWLNTILEKETSR